MTSSSSGIREAATAEVVDVASDVEASEQELSSGDDSTDIDAVVKEYRDRIQVITSVYYNIDDTFGAVTEQSTAELCVAGSTLARNKFIYDLQIFDPGLVVCA